MGGSDSKPILVTGATGYIASHVIQLLLSKCKKVRGTVRSLANTSKYSFLKEFKGSENLELVEADLVNEECWDKVVEGCDYVLHIASPIPPYVPKNQDQVIIPAVNGTKFVLNAAIKQKVKRLVFTSSCLTLWFGNQAHLLTQQMWGDENKCAHYPKSKILAEKALWQIYNSQNLKQSHTEVVSVLPSLILGPGIAVHGNSSEALIAEILKGGFPGIPDPVASYSVVDVRDVAVGHLKALEKQGIDGQRIALSAGRQEIADFVHHLKQGFPNAKIKDQKVTLEQIKASGNPIAQRSLMVMGKRFQVDNTKSVKLLNMQYIPLRDTVIDMGKQLIKLGLVKLE